MIKGYYDVIKCKLNIPTIQPKLQMKEITPSTEEQYIIPDDGYDGLASAIVKAVTNEIDSNILPENIRLGKSILGISGNLEPDKPDQSKTVIPTTEEQTVRADEGYELASVKVEAVPDETPELNAQDTALINQETVIEQLNSVLNNKIALDLQAATSDANATAGDIAKNKTAYVNGVKLIGTYAGGLDIYVQTTAPIEYDGLWIKSNTYTYSNVKEVANKSSVEASTINIITGNNYETKFSDGNLTYNFNGVYITDSNNDILYDPEIYYGDGTQWVDISPQVPLSGTYAGIRVDFANRTVEELTGSVPVDNLNCYNGRRRCNMQNDGTITAYYGDTNYDNVGSENLQVMVEQSKVYYSLQNVEVDSVGAINKADYIVADTKINRDFELHPAFISNGVEYDKVYVGAFEGTVVNSKLSSIGGGTTIPVSGIVRPTARLYAANRGTAWHLVTKQYEDLESLLMTIELKSFNHQASFCRGVTHDRVVRKCGLTYSLNEKGTGFESETPLTADGSFTWRWRENKYGNLFTILDGMNCNGTDWYIKDHDFVDDTATGYIKLSVSTIANNDIISKFAYIPEAKWIFMPKVASYNTFIRDNCALGSSGWHVPTIGSASGDYDSGGSFFITDSYSSSYTPSWVGCTILAMPTPQNNN